MIVSPQPPCHNRLKSLNSFSVSLSGRVRCAAVLIRRRQAIVVGLEKHGLEPIDALARMVASLRRIL
jgi:hypothetical protein